MKTEPRIADSFTESLDRLATVEKTLAKTAASDLQVNGATPGMRMHRLDTSRDPNFWSVRVNDDLRWIVHRTSAGAIS